MTVNLSGLEVAGKITDSFPGAVAETGDQAIVVKSEFLFDVAGYLKSNPELDFNYLNDVTAVDYYQYFEVVYHLTSLNYNHSLVLKTRCYERNEPTVPSVVSLWRGAGYLEREIYDLMGIKFEGHPDLKRIVLWHGFKGHPLRKDYL